MVLSAIPLIPAAVTAAIVRHQLLDIRLFVSRAIAWLLLSMLAFRAYAALVAVLDQFVSVRIGPSAVATVLGELLDDVAGVGQGAGEPVELGHDQVSSERHAASASRRPGRAWLVPVKPWST